MGFVGAGFPWSRGRPYNNPMMLMWSMSTLAYVGGSTLFGITLAMQQPKMAEMIDIVEGTHAWWRFKSWAEESRIADCINGVELVRVEALMSYNPWSSNFAVDFKV